jgi:hypothetical protein
MATTIHIYDRGAIMRRSWQLAREAREEAARKAFDLDVRIVGARIIHNRPLAAFIAAIPIDLGAAQKLAWAEAKGVFSHNGNNLGGALTVVRHHGALAPLRRRLSRVWPLLIAAARWLNSRFIPSRAA